MVKISFLKGKNTLHRAGRISREVLVRKFRGDFGGLEHMRKDSLRRLWSCKGSQRKGSYWLWSREEGEYQTEANVGSFRYYIIQVSLRNVRFILKGPMESLRV